MFIAQISDMHITAPGAAQAMDIDTAAALRRCVAHLATLEPRPDVVLATGDLVHDGSPAAYESLRALLAPLTMPVYLIPGNHDDRDNLRAAFQDHAYLPRDGEFLQYAVDEHPVRLVGLDTVIPGETGGRICADRVAWLGDRLAESPKRPTIVFMHHPPFAIGIPFMDALSCEGADALGALIAAHPQVERVLCGHVHRPAQIRWYGTIGTTAPSTAAQLRLAFGSEGGIAWVDEPLFCPLYRWQEETGLVTHMSPVPPYYGDPVATAAAPVS